MMESHEPAAQPFGSEDRGGRRLLSMFLPLLLVLLLAGGIRYRLLDVPLERDEGEYAYAGRLILDGVPPYQGIYNMKLPGTYAAYAVLLRVFGESERGIHWGLLVVNAATVVLLFLLARRFLGRGGVFVAAATFAFLSVGQPVQGVFANAEHFVLLFATGGLLLLHRTFRELRPVPLFFSGLLLSTSFLMKQHGAAFVAFGLVVVWLECCRRRPFRAGFFLSRLLVFACGAALPYGLTCLLFLLAGSFDAFWLWTFRYARAYVSLVSIPEAAARFRFQFLEILRAAPLVWIVVAAGLGMLFISNRNRESKFFLPFLVLFSLIAVCPGFYFRPHYFILILPAVGLLAGKAVDTASNRLARRGRAPASLPAVLASAFILLSAYQQREFLFQMTPEEACRSTYGLNPFVESPKIARYIRENTAPDDRIAVLGSEPQIYFYAGRRAATGYVYTYALMEEQEFALRMQEEMIREIESSEPAFLVYVRNKHSWDIRASSHTRILDWFREYRDRNYEMVGLVDMFRTRTEYHWAPDLPWPPRSDYWIAVLKRKG